MATIGSNTAEDQLATDLASLSVSQHVDPRPSGVRAHFICAPQRSDKIIAVSVPTEAACRNKLPPLNPYLDYYTLSLTHHLSRLDVISPWSVRFFSDYIRGDIERYLQSIERSETKAFFRVGMEARFGKIYWRFPADSAQHWAPKEVHTMRNDARGSTFQPGVHDFESIIRNKDCIEESLVIFLRFEVVDGPVSEKYSVSIDELPNGDFRLDDVLKSENLKDRRTKFDFAFPGRKYDVRIGDTAGPIVKELEDGVPRQIANEIVSSMRRLADRKLAFVLKGITKSVKWHVTFIRQKDRKLYMWDLRKGWKLAVYKADQLDVSEEVLSTVKDNIAFEIPRFDVSGNEVELWNRKYWPKDVSRVNPLSPDPEPFRDWTTDEMMSDFTEFVGEAFHVAELLDSAH